MINIEELGFTKEELFERVVESCVSNIMTSTYLDEDEGECIYPSKFQNEIKKQVIEYIDRSVEALAEKHILPNVESFIKDLQLQETTRFGEKKGEPVTFIEYLVNRADNYMQEEVNYEGKTKKQCGSYGFSGKQSRVSYLIDRHLSFSIDTAMKKLLSSANEVIVDGLNKTVKLKLEELSQSLKVIVKTK